MSEHVDFTAADEEARSRKLGRRSGTGQLAGSNFVLDALVEGETVAEVLQSAQHQVRQDVASCVTRRALSRIGEASAGSYGAADAFVSLGRHPSITPSTI